MWNILNNVKNDLNLSLDSNEKDKYLIDLIGRSVALIEDFCKQPISQLTSQAITNFTKVQKHKSWFAPDHDHFEVLLPYTGVIPVSVKSVSYVDRSNGHTGTLVNGYTKDFYYQLEDHVHKIWFTSKMVEHYIYTITVDVGFPDAQVPQQILTAAILFTQWMYKESEKSKGLLNKKTEQIQMSGTLQNNVTYGDLFTEVCKKNLSMYKRIPQ